MSRCKLNPCCGDPAFCKPPPQPETTPEVVTEFTLKMRWHKSGMWMLTSDGIKGLLLTMSTFDGMLEELGIIVPELMRLNGQTFPEIENG